MHINLQVFQVGKLLNLHIRVTRRGQAMSEESQHIVAVFTILVVIESLHADGKVSLTRLQVLEVLWSVLQFYDEWYAELVEHDFHKFHIVAVGVSITIDESIRFEIPDVFINEWVNRRVLSCITIFVFSITLPLLVGFLSH